MLSASAARDGDLGDLQLGSGLFVEKAARAFARRRELAESNGLARTSARLCDAGRGPFRQELAELRVTWKAERNFIKLLATPR